MLAKASDARLRPFAERIARYIERHRRAPTMRGLARMVADARKVTGEKR